MSMVQIPHHALFAPKQIKHSTGNKDNGCVIMSQNIKLIVNGKTNTILYDNNTYLPILHTVSGVGSFH